MLRISIGITIVAIIAVISLFGMTYQSSEAAKTREETMEKLTGLASRSRLGSTLEDGLLWSNALRKSAPIRDCELQVFIFPDGTEQPWGMELNRGERRYFILTGLHRYNSFLENSVWAHLNTDLEGLNPWLALYVVKEDGRVFQFESFSKGAPGELRSTRGCEMEYGDLPKKWDPLPENEETEKIRDDLQRPLRSPWHPTGQSCTPWQPPCFVSVGPTARR